MGKFDMKSLGIAVGPPKTAANNKSYLIYGPPGSGKTRLAASSSQVEALSKTLLVDVEAGSSSIENIYKKNIDVIRPDDWFQLNKVLDVLLNEEHEYQTVVIDTAGKLMEFMERELDKSATRNAYEKWAKMAAKTLEISEKLHRTGLNTVLLAHTDKEKDELTGRVNTFPYFLGQKTGKEAPKIFDVIGYLYVDKHPETGDPLRVLQTEGFDGVVAKDRTDTLPVKLGDPTFSKIYTYINAGIPGKGRTKKEETE